MEFGCGKHASTGWHERGAEKNKPLMHTGVEGMGHARGGGGGGFAWQDFGSDGTRMVC